MADARANVQPTTLVSDHPEEIHRQYVANGHDEHEQTARRHAETTVEDTEIGADDSEGDEDFEEQQGALREGIEDRDETVDGVEREGRDGGDVAGGEEGSLKEEEEEESGAEVSECERAVGVFLSQEGFGGRLQLRSNGRNSDGDGFGGKRRG